MPRKLLLTKNQLLPFVKKGYTRKQLANQFKLKVHQIKHLLKKLNINSLVQSERKPIISKPCYHCNDITFNPKFCSRSCAASYNNIHNPPKRKTTRICANSNCNDLVRNYRSSLCETHYEQYLAKKLENFKLKPLKEYWNRPGLEHLHASSKSSHIRVIARTWFKHLLELPCANPKCNYDKHVELCHIKPIRDFNENNTISDVNCESNLIQLCPNCHWEFDHDLLKLEHLVPSGGIEPKPS